MKSLKLQYQVTLIEKSLVLLGMLYPSILMRVLGVLEGVSEVFNHPETADICFLLNLAQLMPLLMILLNEEYSL